MSVWTAVSFTSLTLACGEVERNSTDECGGASSAEELGGEDGDFTPTPDEGPKRYVSVSVADDYSCGLVSDGSVICWGARRWGEPWSPPFHDPFIAIEGGYDATCGITDRHELRCWNAYGEVPRLAEWSRVWRSVKSVSLEEYAVLVLLEDGRHIGYRDEYAGDPLVFNCGHEFQRLSAVSLGRGHCCGKRALDGDVVCEMFDDREEWRFEQAQIPEGDFDEVVAGEFSTCGISRSGDVSCWGQNPDRVDGRNVRKLAISEQRACGVLGDESYKCWYENGTESSELWRYTDVAVSRWHNCALTDDGRISCWGNGSDGQASVPELE